MGRLSGKEVDDHTLNDYLDEIYTRANKTGVVMVIKTNGGYFQYGDVFEAKTVKGNTNYILFAFVKGGYAYYFHADRCKKVPESKFQSLIDHGDLNPIPREKVDPERISLSVLGLNAVANGMSFEDYLKVIYNVGEGSKVKDVAQY